MLVMIPMMGFLFLTFDIAWSIFTFASLHDAVRTGLRYAITLQTRVGLCQVDSIKQVVQEEAGGLLGKTSRDPGWNSIRVNFLDHETLAASTNRGRNLVEVSVQGYQLMPLFPLFYTDNRGQPAVDQQPLGVTAISIGVLQPETAAGPPCM